MAIFGNISWRYPESDGRGKVLLYHDDIAAMVTNKFFAVIYIIGIPAAIVLNVAVMWYNQMHGKQKNPSFLFKLIAGFDLICAMIAIRTLYGLLVEELLPVVSIATPLQISFSLLFFLFRMMSGIATTVLVMTRYMSLRHPFVRVERWYILLYLSVSFLVILFLLVRCTITHGYGWEGQPAWLRMQQMVIRELSIYWHMGLISLYILNTLLAMVVSSLTLRLIYRVNQHSSAISHVASRTQQNRTSTKIILLMNLGNITFFLILFIAFVVFGISIRSKLYSQIGSGYAKLLARRGGGYFVFILFCLFPDFLTIFNPVVFFKVNKFARAKVVERVSKVSPSLRQSVNSEINTKDTKF